MKVLCLLALITIVSQYLIININSVSDVVNFIAWSVWSVPTVIAIYLKR
jgi:hypothetical protein